MNALLRLPAVLQITGHSLSSWYRDVLADFEQKDGANAD